MGKGALISKVVFRSAKEHLFHYMISALSRPATSLVEASERRRRRFHIATQFDWYLSLRYLRCLLFKMHLPRRESRRMVRVESWNSKRSKRRFRCGFNWATASSVYSCVPAFLMRNERASAVQCD